MIASDVPAWALSPKPAQASPGKPSQARRVHGLRGPGAWASAVGLSRSLNRCVVGLNMGVSPFSESIIYVLTCKIYF